MTTDYYAVLGLSHGASLDDITSAFRHAAFTCHTDRFDHLPEAEKKILEERFKVINEAYQQLRRGQGQPAPAKEDKEEREEDEQLQRKAWEAARHIKIAEAYRRVSRFPENHLAYVYDGWVHDLNHLINPEANALNLYMLVKMYPLFSDLVLSRIDPDLFGYEETMELQDILFQSSPKAFVDIFLDSTLYAFNTEEDILGATETLEAFIEAHPPVAEKILKKIDGSLLGFDETASLRDRLLYANPKAFIRKVWDEHVQAFNAGNHRAYFAEQMTEFVRLWPFYVAPALIRDLDCAAFGSSETLELRDKLLAHERKAYAAKFLPYHIDEINRGHNLPYATSEAIRLLHQVPKMFRTVERKLSPFFETPQINDLRKTVEECRQFCRDREKYQREKTAHDAQRPGKKSFFRRLLDLV